MNNNFAELPMVAVGWPDGSWSVCGHRLLGVDGDYALLIERFADGREARSRLHRDRCRLLGPRCVLQEISRQQQDERKKNHDRLGFTEFSDTDFLAVPDRDHETGFRL